MSLCITDCWLRLSHFKVTPDQLVSRTVAWSFLSSRQQTREPMLNALDSRPVIRFAASVRVVRSTSYLLYRMGAMIGMRDESRSTQAPSSPKLTAVC